MVYKTQDYHHTGRQRSTFILGSSWSTLYLSSILKCMLNIKFGTELTLSTIRTEAHIYTRTVFIHFYSELQPPREDKKPSFNPTYHTHIDNYDVATRFTDPGGLPYHAALGRVHVDLLMRLTDSARIPFSAHHLSKFTAGCWHSLLRTSPNQLSVLRNDLKWRSLETAFNRSLVALANSAKMFDALPAPKE